MTALVVGLAIAVALLALLVAGLLRAHADVLRVLHQMGVSLDPAGSREEPLSGSSSIALRPTPGRPEVTDLADLVGTTPSGDALSVAVAGVAHDTLLAFLSSGCATCRAIWEVLRKETPDVPGGARLVVVTRGSEAESPGAVLDLSGGVEASGALKVIMSSEAWEHYDVPYAPYFVLVSGSLGRVVGEGVAASWEQVSSLVANAMADRTTDPRRSRADRLRDAEADHALEQAGIGPGDPRLYPASLRTGEPTGGPPG